MTRTAFLRAVVWLALCLQLSSADTARPSCPPDTPPECSIDDQFASGRWDLSQLSGSYTLDGAEKFYPFLDDQDVYDDYDTSATLTVEMVGGPEENYIDVECDGTVSGEASERITGNVTKVPDIFYFDPEYCSGEPVDMDWNVTIERTYSISGNVTGSGQLDLDYQVHTATIDIDGLFAASIDCLWFSNNAMTTGFDISGDTESVTLSGAWSPGQTTWSPTVSLRSGPMWVDDIAHRLRLNGEYEITNCSAAGCTATFSISPALTGSTTQPDRQLYNEYFVQSAVTVTQNVSATLEPKTPVIESFSLDEPSAFLQDVTANTSATAEIDWRGQAPDQVEFTYGSTTETVAGSNSVTWDFDAGESGTTIQAVAIQGSERSQPYVISAPKVTVPGWAGSSSDWSGQSGVRYDATLDWPISLQTTQTLDTISLFTGIWGIDGSASSTFEAAANSNGSPGSGSLETSASFKAAGNGFDFSMNGSNTTTLSCSELTTTGSATGTLAGAQWQKTLNPLTTIPGLQASACALSGLLCGAINAIGIKASATATLDGTATFTGEGAQIQWDGGSLGGTITGRISADAGLPPPLASLASVSVYGGGSGCMEVMVAPDFELTKVAGELEVGATASFIGLSAEANHTWPFGGGCGRAAQVTSRGTTSAFVPADGQLATAAAIVDGDFVGIAVWSELPAGQTRPSGDIHYRIWRDGTWGATHALTTDADADTAPAVVFEPNDEPLIVWQRSVGAVPTATAELPAFANAYELHSARIDLATELPISTSQLTSNSTNDFGPRLVQDTGGNVHAFWQRVSGIELLGTDALPASILHSSWDAAGAAWSPEEVVASELTGVWGFSAAAHSHDEMLIGLTIDGDEDPATDHDRELFQITRTAGVWMLPSQVTINGDADDSVLAFFDDTGSAGLLWRRDDSVRQVRGDLSGIDELAFTTLDPTTDAGVGLGFAHGQVIGTTAGAVAVWPESTELLLTRDAGPSLGWETPSSAFAHDAAQRLHSISRAASDLLIGWSTREFVGGNTGLSELVEPQFSRRPAQPLVFADGFESGDAQSWSSALP